MQKVLEAMHIKVWERSLKTNDIGVYLSLLADGTEKFLIHTNIIGFIDILRRVVQVFFRNMSIWIL